MKKSILAIAVASLAASSAALADDPTVYGNVHLSLNQPDNDGAGLENNLKVSSNTSAIGVKGSEDLGDGWKAIYKVEFQINMGPSPQTSPDPGTEEKPNSSFSDTVTDGAVGTLSGRDQFVGLQAGFGTIKFGTMSSNYKQMGGKVDPLYRTPLEGRGFLKTQSSLHGGIGINAGRQTHTAQYVSPKFAGVQLVANTTFSGSSDETNGLGVRWSNKNIMVYADWIDAQVGRGGVVLNCTDPCTTESAVKVGGKFSADAFSVALQYEDAADRIGADYVFLAGTFNIDKNNMIALTYGMQDIDEKGGPSADTDGLAIAYDHKMSKMTNVYVGYGVKSNDVSYDATTQKGGDESLITAGIRKKF